MSEKSYQAADVRRKTAQILAEVVAGAVILIHCSSALEQAKLHNTLNVQRFRCKLNKTIRIHRDADKHAIILTSKAETPPRKPEKKRTEAGAQVSDIKVTANLGHPRGRPPTGKPRLVPVAKERAKPPTSKVCGVPQKEQAQDSRQIAKAAIDGAAAVLPIAFEWRRPVGGRESDVFYWCDACCWGFMVAPDVTPDRCPYCGDDDSFARDGQVAPYLKEARKQQRERRERRESFVIEPKEEKEE